MPDKELRFRFDVGWESDRYRNDSVIDRDGEKRIDHITTMGFRISQVLMDDPRHGLLVLHGLILLTDANSNVTTVEGENPFTYDRDVYGFQFHWSW